MYRIILTIFSLFLLVAPTYAQETPAPSDEDQPEVIVSISTGQQRVFTERRLAFDLSGSTLPEDIGINEVVWDFGDGVRTTGEKVTHSYRLPGTYKVSVRLNTDQGSFGDTTEITVFEHVAVIITDTSAPEEAVELQRQQAAEEDLLLFEIRTKSGGPEAIVEEELTGLLVDARDAVARSNLIITWTSGSVGTNVLSKFSQRVEGSDELSREELSLSDKGIVMLSDTPFGVLAPSAQNTFDQLQPSYIILTKPEALDLLTKNLTAQAAQEAIVSSPVTHRLLGTFSARTVRDLGVTNFMSFAINFLVNRGVPINNIILILMLPVIATILAFSRQVIGIKAFGLITPAMTTLSFLVLGLQYGLIVFSVVLAAGTFTRLILRKLHLLYLPRMGLVLTNVSLATLGLYGIGILTGQTTFLSFSIFPILILILLAEEFISVQFTSGAKRAFTITAFTLSLAIGCYFIVSWQLMRTIIVSYPEVVLLAIPINITLGRWTGLRLTEYFRFRKLFRYTS